MNRYLIGTVMHVWADDAEHAAEQYANEYGAAAGEDVNYIVDHPEDYWEPHPLVEDWQYEVANGDTREGFWDWLEGQEKA